jgi:hypothetical protein
MMSEWLGAKTLGMNRLVLLWVFSMPIVVGCASALEDRGTTAASPPLHRGPGGTYVPGDTRYHGSGGP